MKTTVRALSLLLVAGIAGHATAGTIAISPTTATGSTAGGPTNPASILVTYTADAVGETTNNLTARVIYDTANFDVVITDGLASCVDNAGEITVLSNNFTMANLASGTLCSLAYTSIAAAPAAVYSLNLVTDLANDEGCATNVPAPTAVPCTLVDGQITLSAGTFAFTVAPTTLTFNGVVASPAPTQITTITATAGNTGAIVFTGCSITGANAADFSVTPNGAFNVAINGTQNLTVGFTAGALGARTASLDCATSNGSGTGFPVTLNGTGVTNTLNTTPAVVTFPATLVSTPAASQNVTATAGAGNTGNVTITSCAISGPDATSFSQTPPTTNVAVAPGASVNVPVGFTPTAAGPLTATLTCNLTNGPAATFTTTLNGTGTAAAAIIGSTPATLTPINGLGSAGTPLTRLVNFANTGNLAGTVTCTVTGAGFTVTGSPLLLAATPGPGNTGNIGVTGNSLSPATLTGNLDCTGTDGSVFSFPLSFVFGAPAIAQIPVIGDFGRWALLGLFAGVGMLFAFRSRN